MLQWESLGLPWPLAAAGLSSGLMLIWAAAAAIPIVLHFLNRRRQQPVAWAAMQLLRQVVEQQARRTRLEQLILLALRVLILLTLAAALARPFLDRDDSSLVSLGQRPPKLWIVAVDTSYSMGYRSEAGSPFEAARQHAVEMIQASQQGDAFALVTLGQPSRSIIAAPTFAREGMLNELQRLAVLDTGSDLASCLTLIESIAEQARATEGLPDNVHITLLSDLGSDCWRAAVDGPERSRLQSLQQDYQVDVVDLGAATPVNVAVTAVQPATSRAMAGNVLGIEAVVEATGASFERLPVQLALDGQTVASEYIDAVADQPQTVRFEVLPRTSGVSVLSVIIPDDALVADNRRDHVIEIRDQYRLLIVENRPGDARLLKLALQPPRQATIARGIATMTPLELLASDFNDWDVIIFNDLSLITAETLNRLESFARGGGSVIFCFGPQTRRDAWNGVGPLHSTLLGFELAEPSAEAEWSIDPLDYRSPVVAPFSGFPDAGLLTTPIFRLWTIANAATPALQIDLATTDGKPLIVRQRLGAGWIASCLSAPQDGLDRAGSGPAWNAMATWPSFLPLMQQLVQTVLNTNEERTNILTGELLQGSVRDSLGRAQVTLVRPDGSETLITTDAIDEAGVRRWVFGQTEQRGLYRAQYAAESEQLFAVNIRPIESGLRKMQPAQLPQSTRDADELTQAAANPDLSTATHHGLAKLLLGLLLLLLLSESWLAWSLGRRIG